MPGERGTRNASDTVNTERESRRAWPGATYILGNPIRVGLTSQLDEYPFTWCRWSMR